MFRVPEYHFTHASHLGAYAVLGFVGGCASLAFVKLALFARPRLRALPPWTWYIQPAVAGLAIAFIAWRYPQVTGAGYEYVDQAMHDRYAWQTLAVIGALKIVATVLSFSSGTPGGLFAPTLFIGAMIGGAVCGATRALFPAFDASTGTFALIGMGAVFAGILRAPITSVFMIIEVSGNYSIILPVMISNTIAYLVSRRFQHHALFDVLSRQDGTELPSMEEERESDVRSVEHLMRHAEGLTLTADEAMTLADARAARVYLYPDQSIETALRVLRGRPLVPVVHRADPQRLVGVVAWDDVVGIRDSRDS